MIHSCHLNVSPKMSYGVPECDIVMPHNSLHAYDFVITRGVICARSYINLSLEKTNKKPKNLTNSKTKQIPRVLVNLSAKCTVTRGTGSNIHTWQPLQLLPKSLEETVKYFTL